MAGLGAAPAAAQQAAAVSSIVIEGAQRIEAATIKSYLVIREGDPFDARRVDESLKKLFATGLFADVSMGRQGNTLIVRVIENPIINRIAFEGNLRVDDDTLQAEVTLRPRVIYTRTKVQNDVQRILTIYRRSGRFAATVEPKVIQLDQNRVDLVFEIVEGDLTEVENIRFIGNRVFSDSKLRETVRTKESRWYRFLSQDANYDPDRLTYDRELLRRFYLSEGYADFRVISAVAELTPDRQDFFITFTIEEGEQYDFGKVEVEAHLRDLKVEQIKQAVEIESGETYNADEVEKTIDRLTDEVGNLGYAFVDIRPRIDRDREKRIVNVTFEVNEGPRVFVERIDIHGNVRTLDEVVRREFRLVEGDAFNAAKLRRSRKRIQDLNFFETVTVEQVPGSAPDKTVVDVNVQEKSTGSLSIGAGFSTSNGFLADFGIREANLMGRGQDLALHVTLAQRQSAIDLSFTEPYFLDREVRAGFDIFHTATDLQDTSSSDSTTTGGSLRMGYPITESLSQSWRYTFKIDDVTNVSSAASAYILAQEGTQTTSEVSHTILYDKRDSVLMPTDGWFAKATTDLAGLGGSVRHMRNKVQTGKYFPIADDWVFSLIGSAGYIFGIGRDVRFSDRFFVGGDDVRGFATSGIGPRDIKTKDSLGAEWMYTGSAQLSFPLGLPNELGIRGRVFSDLGSAGKVNPTGSDVADTGSLRMSAGAGLTWNSPFGPMGVDLGFAILNEDHDELENVRVNFGTRF